jgi:hypothetical protein
LKLSALKPSEEEKHAAQANEEWKKQVNIVSGSPNLEHSFLM